MSDHSHSVRARVPQYLWWWGPVLAYAALVFVLSSLSHPPDLPSAMSDKSAHSFTYTGLAFLVLRALVQGRWPELSIGQAIGAVLLTTAYGATDEFHQLFVPGRTADLRDLAADAVGALIAVGIAWVIVRVRAGWSER